jgi:hypothetical protein
LTDLVTGLQRGNALFKAIWVSVFAALGTYITIRMIAQGAEVFGVILIGALDVGLWWRAWSLFQKSRRLEQPPEAGAGA